MEDDAGSELIRVEGEAHGNFRYGLGAGYPGSYAYTGRFRGRDIAGIGYIEHIDHRCPA